MSNVSKLRVEAPFLHISNTATSQIRAHTGTSLQWKKHRRAESSYVGYWDLEEACWVEACSRPAIVEVVVSNMALVERFHSTSLEVIICRTWNVEHYNNMFALYQEDYRTLNKGSNKFSVLRYPQRRSDTYYLNVKDTGHYLLRDIQLHCSYPATHPHTDIPWLSRPISHELPYNYINIRKLKDNVIFQEMLKFLFFYLTIFYLKDFFSIIYKRVKFCSTETLLTDGFVHPDKNLKYFLYHEFSYAQWWSVACQALLTFRI